MQLAAAASALILVTAFAWSTALALGAPSREAPVGHRQPKGAEVPGPGASPDRQKRPGE